jgi:hypothetical protein
MHDQQLKLLVDIPFPQNKDELKQIVNGKVEGLSEFDLYFHLFSAKKTIKDASLMRELLSMEDEANLKLLRNNIKYLQRTIEPGNQRHLQISLSMRSESLQKVLGCMLSIYLEKSNSPAAGGKFSVESIRNEFEQSLASVTVVQHVDWGPVSSDLNKAIIEFRDSSAIDEIPSTHQLALYLFVTMDLLSSKQRNLKRGGAPNISAIKTLLIQRFAMQGGVDNGFGLSRLGHVLGKIQGSFNFDR